MTVMRFGVLLDMSKKIDKVWHKGLIFQIKQHDVSGNLLSTLTDFLNLRKQRVVLNDQLSILGPLLLLIFINDPSGGLTTSAWLFADYVLLFFVVYNIMCQQRI